MINKTSLSKLLITFLFFLGLSNAVLAQHGTIKGKITDAKTKEALIGASVLIEGTTNGAAADLDGGFVIANISPGNYILKATYIGYTSFVIENVLVEDGKETILHLEMQTDDIGLDEVVVVATPRKESERILLMDQKGATVIRESVGAKQLSMQGVSDAATATGKITGVVRSETSGDVYVRGLGDRYLSTTMNGLPIPSDDVDKKNIDLGLFDTSVIQNIGISKTYDPESYIDQTAGNINIVSKEFIEQFSIGLQGGFNSSVNPNNVFGNFKASPNLANSTATFYSRKYNLLDAMTRQSWDPAKGNAPLDYGISTIGGYEFKLFENPLSLFYTLSYKKDYNYTQGVYRRFNSNVLYSEFLDTESWTSNETLTGLVNLAYRFHQNHKINYNFLLVGKLRDNVYEQGRNGEGYKLDMDEISNSFFARDMNLKTTQLMVNQLLGNHRIADNQTLQWGLGYNTVAADEPNRIRNYTGFHNNGLYFSYRIADFENRKSSQEIDDNEINGYLKDRIAFRVKDNDWHANIGVNYRHKTRDFHSQFVGADLRGTTTQAADVDNLSGIFTSESFTADKIKTLPEDVYNASLSALAGFVSLEFDFGKLDGNAALRYERNTIEVDWDINNDDPLREPSISRTYNELYPSINLKYELTDRHNLRLSASKTLTLPEFKEIAPFAYTSPNSTLIQGTPELKASENYNLDAKWEYYKSNDELISVAAFYKNIQDPINITSLTGGAGYLIYANTGEEANVFGIEAEARLNLYKSDNNELRLILNGTRMWLKQDLLEGYRYKDKTTSGLQGASEFITNASLQYENKKHRWQASISGNYSSDKIYALGSPKDATNRTIYYNDEIIEKGFATLDAVISKDITDRLSIKLLGRNLLNPQIELTQNVKDLNTEQETNYIVDSYKKGIKLQLSVNYTF
ncbi:TonB-dependent receptor domain-containing protein [Limibacterium fermenti]|uniref:TonB-dependent receptor n=1 Tax=Limibacterium fermenti TaxID=3229863 RepID=UPI003A74573C